MWAYGRNYERASGQYAIEIADSLAAYAPSGSVVRRLTVADGDGQTPPQWQAAGRDAVNEGRGLIALVATWGKPYSWTFLDVNQMPTLMSQLTANPNAMPFFLGPTCEAADFDQRENPFYGTPLVERMLLSYADRGVWGCFGPTRGSWQTGDWWVSREFMKRGYVDGASSGGAAAAAAIRTVMAQHPEWRALAEEFVFLGDPAVRLPLSVAARDCNGNGVRDEVDIAQGLLIDADCDGVADACQPPRVVVNATDIIASPDGSGEGIDIAVRTGDVCVTSPELGRLGAYAVRVHPHSDSVRVWSSVTRTDLEGDTLFATAGAAQSGMARILAREISGCGVLRLRVYVGGRLVGDDVRVRVRSVDFDRRVIGAVDGGDLEAATTGAGGAGCGDFDEDGLASQSDGVAVSERMGQHAPRALEYPLGGEAFGWGQFVTVRWRPTGGALGRVELSLVRDGVPSQRTVLASGLTDDGSESVPLYPGDAPRGDYRIEVRHSAALPPSGLQTGSDLSDGVFHIDAAVGGDGCPVVDCRVEGIWSEENTILGRSLSGALGLDSYRLRSVPTAEDGLVRVRVRENDQELTTLDQVRLIAIDHVAGVRAYAVGDRVVVGRRAPAQSVTTAAGLDVTALVSGSGGGFLGGPGDTLILGFAPQAPPGALAAATTNDPDDYIIDDGGGKGGGTPVIWREAGELSASSIDAQILGSTGIRIEAQGADGGWSEIARRYPREHPDEAAFEAPGNSLLRLVFVGQHLLRFVGRLEVTTEAFTAHKLPLVAAAHSRLGDVRAAVDTTGNLTTELAPGDTTVLSFGWIPVAEGLERELMLLSRGVYTANLPAKQGPVARDQFALWPGQPNPFGEETRIRFALPKAERVRLEVLDAQGRRVVVLADRRFDPGEHFVAWDGRTARGVKAGPGIYFYRFEAGVHQARGKLVLLH